MPVTHASESNLACCEVAQTAAVEDYLKTIYSLVDEDGPATTSKIADRLGVAAPSASAMVKRLAEGGLVEHPDRRQVALTVHGREHALRVVRRHRLLETFLARVLGVPWDEVHAEAEVLEHALSDRLEARIDALLDHPAHDPHGDPIPPSGAQPQRWAERWGEPLDGVAAGTRFRVERVSDRDSAALRYLADLGIGPGVVIDVVERAPFGGPLWVRVAGERRALGAPLTRLIHGTTPASAPEAGR